MVIPEEFSKGSKVRMKDHFAITWPRSKRLNNKQKACDSWRHHFMV